MTSGWRVGIDIGGTFTDIIAVRPSDGSVRTAKVATTTSDRVGGLEAAFAAVGLRWPEIDDLIHGTTMVTNAIIEDQLADVALVTTEGFSDTLAIGRQNRRHLYRLDLPPKAKPQTMRPMKPRTLDWNPRYSHSGTDTSIVTVGRMSVLRSCAPSVLRQASSGQTAIIARISTPSGRATMS